MDPVLKQLDGVLDDEGLVDRVFAALSKRHQESARTGRPSTPAEVVLRMLVLKHLRGWSYERYEQLQWEVTGNFLYRRFCRIDGGDHILRIWQLLMGAVTTATAAKFFIGINNAIAAGVSSRLGTGVVARRVAGAVGGAVGGAVTGPVAVAGNDIAHGQISSLGTYAKAPLLGALVGGFFGAAFHRKPHQQQMSPT